MSTVQEALKAREERKKKEVETKNSKVDSALDAYKSRKQSSAKSAISDIEQRLRTEYETLKNLSAPSWGEGSLKDTLDATRESRINISKLQRELESYRNYFDDEEKYNSTLSVLEQMNQSYDSYLGSAEIRDQLKKLREMV